MQHPGVAFLHPDPEGIAILTPENALRGDANLIDFINKLGNASSRAQNLAHTITTYSAFTGDGNEILYILVSEDKTTALGFVKIGPKHLYLWDHAGIQHEMTPLCLLDFFTYPSEQRKGYGRKMIDRVLADKHLQMQQIPIDRPSHLCLAFMRKHFGLKDYLKQANNFVVFDEFWMTEMPPDVRLKDTFFQPRTPVKRAPQYGIRVAPHASTPIKKRTGVNPITWEPYD